MGRVMLPPAEIADMQRRGLLPSNGAMLPPAEIADMQRRGLLPSNGAILEASGKKPSKYGSKRCVLHTPAHASLRECKRYQLLDLLQRGGKIAGLQQQVAFRLCPAHCHGHSRHLYYRADFTYRELDVDGGVGPLVVEDTKGVRTPLYIAKRHLMEAQGFQIRET